MSPHVSFAVHQEPDDVRSPSLLRIVAASLVIGGAGVVVAGALVVRVGGSLEPAETGAKAAREPARWPVERTQIGKTRRGADLRDEQRRVLERGAQWVDAGVVTLPVDEAVDIVLGQSP